MVWLTPAALAGTVLKPHTADEVQPDGWWAHRAEAGYWTRGHRMAAQRRTERSDQARDSALRRHLVLLAVAAVVLSLVHFADHTIRGGLVIDHGLNPAWNHSGWPFNTLSDKPYVFSISFVVVFGLLLGGILFTLRGLLWAGYWLATSIAISALLVFVHFIGASPGAAETPSVIASSYDDTVLRVLALIDLVAVFAVFVVLAVYAVRTRQRSGHW